VLKSFAFDFPQAALNNHTHFGGKANRWPSEAEDKILSLIKSAAIAALFG